MLRRYGEVQPHISVNVLCIERTLDHMLLNRGALGAVGVIVEEEHPLRQRPVAHAVRVEKVVNDGAVLLTLHQLAHGTPIVAQAGLAQFLIEGKRL